MSIHSCFGFWMCLKVSNQLYLCLPTGPQWTRNGLLRFYGFLRNGHWKWFTRTNGTRPWWHLKGETPTMICYPNIGVPQNGWFIMENSIKMDDLGVPLFFWKHPDLWIAKCCNKYFANVVVIFVIFLSSLFCKCWKWSEVGKLVQNHPQKDKHVSSKIHGKRMWKANYVQARHEIILEQGLFDVDALILDRSYITTTLCQSWMVNWC